MNKNSVQRKYDAAKTNLDNAKAKLEQLTEQLNEIKTNGTDTKVLFGLEEKQKYIDFLEAIENGSEVKTIYYSVSILGRFSFSVSSRSGFNPVTSQDYLTVLGNAISGKTVTSVSYWYNYKEGSDPTEKSESKTASIAASSTADALLGAFFGVIGSFEGTEKTVKTVNDADVAVAQEKVDTQQDVVNEKQTEFDNANLDLKDATTVVNSAQKTVNDAQTAYETASAAVTTAEGTVTTAQGKVTAANEKITAANTKIAEQESEIEKINASINEVNNYKNLSITNNITVTDASFTLGDWGNDYEITGNGNVITYPAGASGNLVGSNRGYISNIGVVNGKIARTNNNSIKIGFETTDQRTYDLYDAAGTHSTAPISGELGYRVRNYFGLTINSDGTFGTLDKKADNNIVYKVEWTKANTKTASTFYANVNGGDLSYNPAANKKNAFVYVQDTDIEAEAFTTGNNIVVNGICRNAVFVDDAAEGDDGWVYIPYAFTAKELTYERTFGAKALATVCLPFEVPSSNFESMGLEKIMQFSNVETATNTYWFQYQEGSMRANEPYVLKFKNNGENIPNGGKVFQALTDINVAATGSIDRYEVAPSRPGTGAEFLGVFVSTNASMLARGGYKLYGFGDGVFRPMKISESVKCQAFRTYVKTPEANSLAPEASFTIGELDEMGNVVNNGGTTGVNTVVADANTFSVKGGNGAIIVTTGKAQKVSIYTVGGSLVKASNVEAGTETIPVGVGVYIVNGKKVVVK